jgi:hypothetical protein
MAVKLMGSDTAMDKLMRAPCLRHHASKQRGRAFSITAALASTAIVRAGVAGLTLTGTFVATTISMVSVCESFVSILARSRRLQAKRVIRQYRHLIAKECFQSDGRIFQQVQEGNLDMTITDSSHARRPSPPLKAWTIAVLAGFGILHVVGGCMLHHAPSIRPIETATTAIHDD